ncbi:MAG: hypothetical protein Unbinned838contig1000_7 [Prokaryotic dsDNA virus sp.]|nr:MAG: hypothetical protein Unbinned838contig1000_7 [Prokaryotic dsDNA virus sp.]|tara:strand:+ start:5826 stop:6554 length:729 start_codon:yes stop_codon:yes gene_type:complete
MTNLNTIVYDIQNIAYGGESSDDADLSFRQVAYWVKQERSMLLSQMMSRKVRVPAVCVEYLNCVYLEPADASECCELESGIHILKSVNPIPTTIQRNGRDSILAVESLDGMRPFSETTDTRRKWNKYNKYTGSNQRWYIKNGYLYVSCDIRIEAVKVTGVFEDPEEVWKINHCTSSHNPILSACEYDWEYPFPISLSMAEQVTSIILQKRVNIILNAPSDEENNAKEDSGQMQPAPRQNSAG